MLVLCMQLLGTLLACADAVYAWMLVAVLTCAVDEGAGAVYVRVDAECAVVVGAGAVYVRVDAECAVVVHRC